MVTKLESIVHYKSNCHRVDGLDYQFHTFLLEINQPLLECFDTLFDMVQRVWWWKPDFFGRGINIVQGAKLGGMIWQSSRYHHDIHLGCHVWRTRGSSGWKIDEIGSHLYFNFRFYLTSRGIGWRMNWHTIWFNRSSCDHLEIMSFYLVFIYLYWWSHVWLIHYVIDDEI